MRITPVIITAMLCATPVLAEERQPERPAPAVVALLEDNAATLLPLLTNPTGDPGEGHVEQAEVFAGASAVRIVPMQRFHPHIPGWRYRIREKPARDEYRYVRFAWKADGCIGIMIQFHDDKDWNVRYTAGQDAPGWGCKFVAPEPPGRWTVVTRDLFADFGERAIEGMALTAFGGQAAYFDHIYFGRTIDDLDRIDATVAAEGGGDDAGANPPPPLTEARMERLWLDLCGDDAPRAYRARCALLADPDRAAPFLKDKAAGLTSADQLPAQIAQWIADLDADEPRVRERASEHLARHIDAAAGLLEAVAESTPSLEVRTRAATLLRGRTGRGPWPDPLRETVHVLRLMGTPASRECLEALAKGADGSPAAAAAREALADH